MKKFSIFSWFNYPLPIEERLRLIKQAGFDATILWWQEDDKHLQPEMARKIGLEVENIHVPFNNPNSLWKDGFDGEDYTNMLITCLDDCHKHAIPSAVIHITGFSDPPEITYIGLDRIKRLVDFAEKKSVNLAFENLNFLQHIDYVFKNIKSSRLGFCYDSGHENAFHPDTDCLEKYGDKLFALHLDDNFGNADTHLLPYDGTINWDRLKNRLKMCCPFDYMSLEVDFNVKHPESHIFKDLSAQEYLTRAYERATKILQDDDAYQIRAATISDLPAWRTIAGDVAEIFGNPIMADDPEFIDYAKRKIQQEEALVAVDENNTECLGFIGFSRHYNRITWFGVLQKYRNKGIGSKLLKEALNKMDCSKEITVDTYRENYLQGQPARHVYFKYGFIETDKELHDHLGNERSKLTIIPKII